MRALGLFALTSLATAPLSAQINCSTTVRSAALHHLHEAQAATLAIKQASMDSGVPKAAIPTVLVLKAALAAAADAVLACHSTSDTPAVIDKDLQATLHAAAPGMTVPDAPAGSNEDTPAPGTLGNDISASATLLSSKPRLLGIELASSVPCGSDSQLLIYQADGSHWQRKARWSTGLAVEKDLDFSSDLAGDFVFTNILPMDGSPDGWRAVIAHGTPWCTSRFSTFGLAVLAPSAGSVEGQVVWHTRRDFSRGDFVPRLKSATDTFEFRINEDAQLFDIDNAFERTVIYRYRVSPAGLTRVEPIALNARGFVEEWLSMPAQEARAQQQMADNGALQQTHDRAQSPAGKGDYTSWNAGPVRSCAAAGRVQVAFDSQQEHFVAGKPGGEQGPATHNYFQLQQVPTGYQLLSVSAEPDPTCTGPDLMRKPAPASKPR